MSALILASQVAALRNSTAKIMAALRTDLGKYRMIMLLPASGIASPLPQGQKPAPGKRDFQKRRPAPLTIPDPRLLEEMDPRITGFIRDNPKIESIFTREIVRDVDSGTLDLSKLIQKSSLKIRFEIDEDGHVLRPRIQKASKVPSIDHLAIELVFLAEKYKLLANLKNIAGVVAAIEIDQQVTVRLEAELRDAERIEELRRQIQNLLALLRFTLPQDEAGFFLKDLSVDPAVNRVIVTKSFGKEALTAYLMQYYHPTPQN